MNYKYIIDNCLDDREFRNFVNAILIKKGYTYLRFDDARISDEDQINNNDILVKKDDLRYTVQTFLNREIKKEEINETLDDMKRENVLAGIIITNTEVSSEIMDIAKNNNIEIWDKNMLLKSINF